MIVYCVFVTLFLGAFIGWSLRNYFQMLHEEDLAEKQFRELDTEDPMYVPNILKS